MSKSGKEKFIAERRKMSKHDEDISFVARLHKDDLNGADIGEVLYFKERDKVAIRRHTEEETGQYTYQTEWINHGIYGDTKDMKGFIRYLGRWLEDPKYYYVFFGGLTIILHINGFYTFAAWSFAFVLIRLMWFLRNFTGWEWLK